MLYSLSPVYVCVVTQLRIAVDDINVKQSDYAFLWDSGAPPTALASKFSLFFRNRSGSLWNIPLVGRLYMLYVFVRYGLSIFNPGLKKVNFD